MSIMNHASNPFNLRLFNPEVLEESDPLEEFDQIEGLETSAWFRDQAARFRVMGSELSELVAERLEDLASDWKVLSAGEPISVEEFREREWVMRELRETPLYL